MSYRITYICDGANCGVEGPARNAAGYGTYSLPVGWLSIDSYTEIVSKTDQRQTAGPALAFCAACRSGIGLPRPPKASEDIMFKAPRRRPHYKDKVRRTGSVKKRAKQS